MKKIFTLIVFAAIFLFKPFYLHAQAANVNDSLALVDLYNSTGGANWANNSGWLNGPVKNWSGIYLNSSGRVVQIILAEFGLTNSLPASLGNLDSLTFLDLSQSYSLTGVIPASFNNLTNLQHIDLDHCQLTGTVPRLSNLLKLQYLDFSINQLTGTISTSLDTLVQLQYLSLGSNQLTGTIPAWLSDLSNLQTLDLSGNQLTGNIPPSLGNLSNLQSLALDGNELTDTIPASLGKLTQLYSLFLQSNQLSGNIPTSLGNLTKLGLLYLNENQLTGNLPNSLANTKLTHFEISNNHLNGSIPAFVINISASPWPQAQVTIYSNNFTFDGMEAFAARFNNDVFDSYSPQATIPLHYSTNKLSVYAGGTLTNNTYKWYKGDTLIATINADSTYKPTAAGNYSVAVTNSIATELTLYSDTIAITDAELPITYLSFTAQPTHGGNLLQWQTSTEINSAYFNVQRSVDGVRFTNIAQINAAGNSNTVQNYQYTDALTGLNPVPPALFYRLQEADKDGDVTYSKIIKLDNNSTQQTSLSIFPNPVHDVLNVQLAGITGTATIMVTDAGGKTLQSQQTNVVAGQAITINTQPLAAGVYFVQVLQGKQNITQKFVKE